MREAPIPKAILATAAIALFAFAMFPGSATASSGNYSCNTFSMDLSNFMTNPSNPTLTPYTLAISGGVVGQKGNLEVGALTGSFNDQPVGGGYNFNTANGKLLAKLVGSNFEIDLAFVTAGQPAGFTFIGTYHVVGQAPQMLLGPLGAAPYCS